jgi:hypothetical protein
VISCTKFSDVERYVFLYVLRLMSWRFWYILEAFLGGYGICFEAYLGDYMEEYDLSHILDGLEHD